MKNKVYILSFTGDPESVAFLKRKVKAQQSKLATARSLGRAAEELFDVRYSVASVDVPRPTVERVKSI